MSGRGARLGLACGLLACAACATTHPLTMSPRIQFTVNGGPYYFKAGRAIPIGPLGGDLSSLVADNADAVRFARRGRRELAIGVPAYVGGLVAIVAGLALAKPTGWAVAGGGLVISGAGIGFMGAGAVNLLDAVNTYNDGLTARDP